MSSRDDKTTSPDNPVSKYKPFSDLHRQLLLSKISQPSKMAV